MARAFSDGSEIVKLPGWIAVTGAVVCIFALMVPTLHALRFFSTCSLLLSSIYTFIAIVVAFKDGTQFYTPLPTHPFQPISVDSPLARPVLMLSLRPLLPMHAPQTIDRILLCVSVVTGLKAEGPRDYSLRGNVTDRTFNAIGALATIAFAFNTGILPEMQVGYTEIPEIHDSLLNS